VNRVLQILQPVDRKSIEILTPLVSEAVELVSDRKDATDVVAKIQSITRRTDIEAERFFELWGVCSDDEYAEELLFNQPQEIGTPTDDEIKTALDAFDHADPKFHHPMIEFFDRNANYLMFTDLMFYPHKDLSRNEMFEEIKRRIEMFHNGGVSALHTYYLGLAADVLEDPQSKSYSRQWAKDYINLTEAPFAVPNLPHRPPRPERLRQRPFVQIIELAADRQAVRQCRDPHWQARQPVGDIMRSRLTLQRGIHGEDNFVDPTGSDACDQCVDAQILWRNAIQRREPPAQHMIAAGEQAGAVERPKVRHFLHHA
jgi:hypothetical protein